MNDGELTDNIFSLWDRLFGTYTPEIDFRKLRYRLDAFDIQGAANAARAGEIAVYEIQTGVMLV